MKAIKTKCLSPTDFKGTRVKASDGDGNNVTLSWDYAHDRPGNHQIAAEELCLKMEWKGTLKGGWFENEMYWVFQD